MVAQRISESEKTYWLIGLMAAWVLLGLIGHDPWKPDEAPTFGLVWRALMHGEWLLPNIAGERSADTAPLFVWTAAVFAKLFSWILPLHDGARLAAAAYMGLAFWCVGVTSRLLYGKGSGRYAVLTLAGCVGLFERGHFLIPETALLCAVALSVLGMAYLASNPRKGGVLLGLSFALAYLSKGWAGGLLVLAVVAGLWLAWAPIRNRDSRVALCWGAALAVALITPWLAAVYLSDPNALHMAVWGEDRPSFAVFSNTASTLLILLWFAFPAWPLALWSARLMQRGFVGGMSQLGFVLPVTAFAALALVIICVHDGRALPAMPLLIPLALLAVPGLDHLKRGQSGFIDWIGIFFFGALIVAAWLYWGALYFGTPAALVKSINKFQPGYTEPVRWFSTVLAVLLTAVWFAMIRPARRTHKRALINWTVGMTAVWGVLMLLGTPFLDFGKSFRIPINSLVQALPSEVRSGKQCLASGNLGEGQRAMLDYLANLRTERAETTPNFSCNWLLMQGTRPQGVVIGQRLGNWEAVWQGGRPGAREEPWFLFKRK